MIRYATDIDGWAPWQRDYRFGAFYVFPPLGVIEEVDALRAAHDPVSAAICAAHVSISAPLPGPLAPDGLAELENTLRRVDPFAVRYGPLRDFPPHPGVVYDIQPAALVERVRAAIHASSIYAGVALPERPVAPHMTVAEFISREETAHLLEELQGRVPVGEFTCDRVEYAVPDQSFRFQRVLDLPLGR